MHQKPDHFEIALTLTSKSHGKQRNIADSRDDFMASCDALYPISNGCQPFPLPAHFTLPVGAVHARLTLDAVLPDGRIIPFILYKKTLDSTDIRNKIKWPEERYKRIPKRIIFCADFGGVCVRNQEGRVIGASDVFTDYVPWDKKLCDLSDEIHAWQVLYERGVSLDREKNIAFNWEDFHAKGIAVCDKAQQLLGRRSQVFYRRLTELPPPNDENSLVVFLPD
ncbi:hypothetical protein [Insolitispirillum peregrinum]|uniref:hypothetical protein n=1 Tax=Insolitispirillum peregrinum TaxID=80876 RepID=UPI003613DF1D